jgi:hypothetical protein
VCKLTAGAESSTRNARRTMESPEDARFEPAFQIGYANEAQKTTVLKVRA